MENLWKTYRFCIGIPIHFTTVWNIWKTYGKTMRFQLFSAFSFKNAEKSWNYAFFSFVGLFNFFPKKSLTLVCGPETRTRSVAPRQGLGLWPLRGSYLRQALGLWPLRGSHLGAWPKNLGPKKMTYIQQAGNHAPKKMTYIQPPCDHAPKKPKKT